MMTATQTSQQVLPTEMRQLLMEVGLMGYGGGYAYEAEILFRKLRIADPTAAYPLLALAQICIFKKDPLETEELLLELELGPHGQDPMVCQWIQDTRRLAIDFSTASSDR